MVDRGRDPHGCCRIPRTLFSCQSVLLEDKDFAARTQSAGSFHPIRPIPGKLSAYAGVFREQVDYDGAVDGKDDDADWWEDIRPLFDTTFQRAKKNLHAVVHCK